MHVLIFLFSQLSAATSHVLHIPGGPPDENHILLTEWDKMAELSEGEHDKLHRGVCWVVKRHHTSVFRGYMGAGATSSHRWISFSLWTIKTYVVAHYQNLLKNPITQKDHNPWCSYIDLLLHIGGRMGSYSTIRVQVRLRSHEVGYGSLRSAWNRISWLLWLK